MQQAHIAEARNVVQRVARGSGPGRAGGLRRRLQIEPRRRARGQHLEKFAAVHDTHLFTGDEGSSSSAMT